MKRVFIFLSIMVLPLCSCTQNNGHIGSLFGLWKLNTITINNELDQKYLGNVFFGFQNDITEMKIIYPNNIYDQIFGRWELQNNKLLLIYNVESFVPFPATYLNSGVNECEIITSNSKEIVFKRTVDGNTYQYNLAKW